MNIKKITDFDFNHKKVLIRVDYNVPIKNGIIQDNNRIVQTLPTLKKLVQDNASLIIISHFGRPNPVTEVSKRDDKFSLAPVRDELQKLLGKRVGFVRDLLGDEVKTKVEAMQPGEVLLFENVRYYAEEMEKDSSKRKIFAKQLAQWGEIFVNDAFGSSHREHASTTTIGEFLPSCSGLLMEKELHYMGKALDKKSNLNEKEKKFTYAKIAIIGGAKISTKIPLIKNLFGKVDKILIGGGMAYTFLKAKGYEVGKSLLDHSLVDTCKELLSMGEGILELPVDAKVGSIIFDTMRVDVPLTVVSSENIPIDQEAVDIGPSTIDRYLSIIRSAETIIWNGPMGVFECSEAAEGTFSIAKGMEEVTNNGSTTIIGGGDSGAAIKQIHLEDKVSHLSTGGGASLEFLEGKILPGVAILMKE